ncbi:thiamine pyrophosphate-binding protein [Thermoplasma sp.]|uniref:thiamine pyrophosphate-binding protein n=1 Tax=Thermoplasma sp. TaxID=1973142 RepID=UPI001283781D|nr:thiamine pyrophosphate-binding protein [Thermoplasma sp.]KAA8923417.1 MAG: thiamine pyrophosphate-binding protein [Thermoplasma sp.]
MKASQIFSEFLKRNGLHPLFGNPGTTEIPMLSYVDDYMLTLHDSISVAMADAYAQYTGRPSIVNLHSLPGISNSMAFIISAMKNNSPVIVTAGQQDRRHLYYDPLLSGDQISLVSNYVKYAYEVRRPEEIPLAMKRAYEISMTPPFGPTFISFPMDVMDEEADPIWSSVKAHPVVSIGDDEIREIMDRVNSAERAAIVFGSEIDMYGAMEEARKFAHALNVPVYVEPWAQSSSYYKDDLYVQDLPSAFSAMNRILKPYDLIIFVGSDIFVYPYTGEDPSFMDRSIFISTRSGHYIGETYVSDPKSFLSMAVKYAKKKKKFVPDVLNEKLVYEDIIATIHGHLKGYTVVDEAVTASGSVRKFFADGPKTYYTSRGGPLGWGDAATVSVAIANRKTVGIIGDGAFMYTPQSLWTAFRYHIPAKFIVLRNNGYNILRSYSRTFGYGVENRDFLRFNFSIEKTAEGFGAEVRNYSDERDLEWISNGDVPKVLVLDVDNEIPDLF